MIVVDIECSGLDPIGCGIWQIGALDLDNPEKVFFEESRIDDEDIVQEEALKVIGKTEDELRDRGKQSQKELIEKFFDWVEGIEVKNCICQNPQFDLMFLKIKADKYGLKPSYPYRAFDTHSVAQAKYVEINGKMLIDKGKSDMNLTNILDFCGMEDNRQYVKDGVVVKPGPPHDALGDAKLTAECFSRILYGKKLLKEFQSYELPDYLKKKSDK